MLEILFLEVWRTIKQFEGENLLLSPAFSSKNTPWAWEQAVLMKVYAQSVTLSLWLKIFRLPNGIGAVTALEYIYNKHGFHMLGLLDRLKLFC